METHIKTVEFERPNMLAEAQSGASCVAHAWAKVPPALSREERDALKARIKRLLKERNAVLVAHYYVDADLQDLAEETGGACRIRWRWPASAVTTRPRHWWWQACASWVRPPRS